MFQFCIREHWKNVIILTADLSRYVRMWNWEIVGLDQQSYLRRACLVLGWVAVFCGGMLVRNQP